MLVSGVDMPEVGSQRLKLPLLFALSMLLVSQVLAVAQGDLAAKASPIAAPGDPSGIAVGSGDTIVITAIDEPELSKTWVISHSGDLYLPYIGRLRAAGKTVPELEHDLTERLKDYIKNPLLTVSVAEFRSRPVTVSGAVRNPGIYQIQGGLTLLQVLTLAGGVEPGGASITLTRRRDSGTIDLQHVRWVNGGTEMAVELGLREILRADGSAAKLELQPYDVVRVERGQDRVIYVAGEVNTPGAIQLQTASSIYVTQALAMAGGYKSTARLDKAVLWNCCDEEHKARMNWLDLKLILAGRAEDRLLKEGDYLLIPPKAQRNWVPTLASVAAMVSSLGTIAVIERR